MFDKVDAILIKNGSLPFIDENFFYFTGMEIEGGVAIVAPDETHVIAPFLEKKEGIEVYKSIKERDEIIKKILKGKRVGVNKNFLSAKDYEHFKKLLGRLIDVSKELKMKRAIKSGEEIRKIKKAVKITKEIIHKIEFEEKSEKEVANEIRCILALKDAEESFSTIVAFGKNSSRPHHIPTTKKFVYPVLVDMGARYKGYCADITTTFMKSKNRKYEVIEEALYMAIDSIEEGIKGKEVYKEVEKFLNKNGIEMIHALGHSIGIKVHDGLVINKKADFEFRNNMTFAIEPAGYFKKYGIRIEEDIIIKNGRARIIG